MGTFAEGGPSGPSPVARLASPPLGTNDLNKTGNRSYDRFRNCRFGQSIGSNGIDVCVSGLITRGDILEQKRQRTNFVLLDKCFEESITYIDHPNIEAEKHLNRSRLHLNRFGDDILADNLLKASRI